MKRKAHNLGLIAATLLLLPLVAAAQLKESPSALEKARSDFIKARTELADASAAISRAEVARMRLERSIEVEFARRPDLLELQQYAGAMSRYFNMLRNAILRELEQDEDYQALRNAEHEAATALAEMKSDPTSSTEDQAPLAGALLDARAELTRFSAAALAMDPAVEDARAEMNRAHDAASKLELHYRRLAANDPRLTQARDEVIHARERADAARSAFAKAKASLAEAEKREAARTAGRRADPPPIHRPEP